MQRQNQSTIISARIEQLIEGGMKDKVKIYTKIVEEMECPRPTVRRVARDLRIRLKKKAAVLG